LGAGKTLTLARLCFEHWFFRREVIFSNFHLFKIPYYYVDSLDKLDKMRLGFVGLDELWLICDARLTKTKKNQLTANILAKSRKRELTVAYTAQLLDQIEKRIRKVTDFTAYPLLNRGESITKVAIFRTGYPKAGTFMKYFYYKAETVKNLYDTNEEIDMVEESKEPMLLIFQENFNREHGYLCQCPTCGTKFFDNWEEADKYASEYWKKMWEKGVRM
jgi:hypothetical protein